MIYDYLVVKLNTGREFTSRVGRVTRGTIDEAIALAAELSERYSECSEGSDLWVVKVVNNSPEDDEDCRKCGREGAPIITPLGYGYCSWECCRIDTKDLFIEAEAERLAEISSNHQV